MKKKILIAVSILLCGIVLTSCGSNNSQGNKKESSKIECDNCGKQLEESEVYKATDIYGRKLSLCSKCCSVLRTAGKAF